VRLPLMPQLIANLTLADLLSPAGIKCALAAIEVAAVQLLEAGVTFGGVHAVDL